MASDVECPIATIYLFEHVAKSGCCPICLELDGWFTAEEEPEPPYEIPQHDKCRCLWRMHTITGLWRDKREEIINSHSELRQQYYDAAVEIVAWDDKIAERELQLGEEKGDKAQQDGNAVTYNQLANQAMDAAQRIMDENEELTPEQQDMVDELFWQAEEYLQMAEDCITTAAEIQQLIYDSEAYIRNAEDQRDAEIYRRDEATRKLNEAEPCLSLGCIEDKAAEIAGSRLIMEF